MPHKSFTGQVLYCSDREHPILQACEFLLNFLIKLAYLGKNSSNDHSDFFYGRYYATIAVDKM